MNFLLMCCFLRRLQSLSRVYLSKLNKTVNGQTWMIYYFWLIYVVMSKNFMQHIYRYTILHINFHIDLSLDFHKLNGFESRRCFENWTFFDDVISDQDGVIKFWNSSLIFRWSILNLKLLKIDHSPVCWVSVKSKENLLIRLFFQFS